jgi:hypothetical protein
MQDPQQDDTDIIKPVFIDIYTTIRALADEHTMEVSVGVLLLSMHIGDGEMEIQHGPDGDSCAGHLFIIEGLSDDSRQIVYDALRQHLAAIPAIDTVTRLVFGLEWLADDHGIAITMLPITGDVFVLDLIPTQH